MHYYQHHIGDFIKDTANLNDHQLATYLRMLWSYYSEERPLGKNLEDLAFAMRSDEKTVGLILRHYFKEAEDGWHHGRCDREIAEFHAKKDKASASANARWKNAKDKTNAKQPQCEGNANASNTDANQEPITNNQVDQKPLSPASPATDCGKPARKKSGRFDPLTAKPENISTTAWADFCAHRHKKSALTEKACELIANKLATHHDPEAVLYRSIENGWTGIFPEQVTHEASPSTRGAGRLSAVDAVKHAIAARATAEAEPGLAGQAVAEDGGAVRPALDGEFRRVG